jgi:hypothetical protein
MIRALTRGEGIGYLLLVISYMWRVLLFLSVLPIAAGLLLRWWFGLRVLAARGRRECRCDPERWEQVLTLPLKPLAPSKTNPEPSASTASPTSLTSAELGRQVRLAALAQWKLREPKLAASRESARRFGLAVPPLSAMVAVFAAILAKIPVFGAIVIFLLATALAVVFGLLSLGSELRAIAITAKSLRTSHLFPRRDDEDAIIECAIAQAWFETVPPVLRLLQ